MTVIFSIIILVLIAVCVCFLHANQRLAKSLLLYSSEKAELIGKLDSITSALSEKQHELISLRERVELLSKENVKFATLYQEVVKNRDALKAEFSNLSQEILESKQEKFSTEAKKEVGTLIADLQKEFLVFKNEIFSPETRSRTELSANLKVLFSNIEKMHMDAENLTNALKNNA
jgi:DNA anti-recombination protein RmuC